MRTLMAMAAVGICSFVFVRAQSRVDDAVVGTWTGPVHCLHGSGDRFVMSIARDASGRLIGTMDWALASATGPGSDVPFTTLRVDGAKITATRTEGDRTAELDAAVENGTIVGRWRVTGIDDVWSFTGRRR